jgi:DNA-binding transcriptional ArsR family regulator
MAAGDIAAHFAVTRPAVSQHLTVLREAGLLTERRDGTRRLYRANPEGLAELRTFLNEMWPDNLARFKAHAEATALLRDSTAERTARSDPGTGGSTNHEQ